MVKPLERPVVLALIYVVGSFILGPAIFLGGLLLFAHGVGDYCDAVHGPPASRDAEFRAAQIFQVTGAGIMLTVGLLLLAGLCAHRHRISRLRLISSSFGILAMMSGFGLVILLSGPGGQGGCSPPGL
ncbi:hypothetical protein AB0H00_23450 [Nocardia sp. NPDC023852]|uniref:hypothetical protein n=1 Tax=Nocardia sp. NPDC023852 TaxID=3154697 RepID=UPI003411009A